MSVNFQKMLEYALKEAGNKTVREALSKELKLFNTQEYERYTASTERDCSTCKHSKVIGDDSGGWTVYCGHPKNTRETNYKYAAECWGNNEYKYWEPNSKGETNQAVKADSGKPQLTLVPRQILFDIAKIRAFGVKKYKDPDNWKKVEIQRYRDATFRHFMAYLDDPQGNDEESGLPHLAHLACNVAFLCELEKEKNEKHYD